MLRASRQIAKPFDNGPHYDHIQYWDGTSEQVPRCSERHGRKMKNTRSTVGMVMVKEETDDNIAGLSENQPTSPPSVAYLKRYLMKNWYKF